jgi:peroxiredoxin
MTKTKNLLLPGVVILVLYAAWLWWPPMHLSRSPDIALTFTDGRHVELQGLRGQPVLVTFWATTCRKCLREMPDLISLYKDLSGTGFEIIAVAMAHDPPNLVITTANERQIPYPIALDIDGKIAEAFGHVRFTPTSFLIAPDGNIVQHKVGEMDMAALRQQIRDLLPQPLEDESRKGKVTPDETGV